MTKAQIDALTPKVKAGVRQYLDVSSLEVGKRLRRMSPEEVLSAFLKWEGIIGYDQHILSIFAVTEWNPE